MGWLPPPLKFFQSVVHLYVCVHCPPLLLSVVHFVYGGSGPAPINLFSLHHFPSVSVVFSPCESSASSPPPGLYSLPDDNFDCWLLLLHLRLAPRRGVFLLVVLLLACVFFLPQSVLRLVIPLFVVHIPDFRLSVAFFGSELVFVSP